MDKWALHREASLFVPWSIHSQGLLGEIILQKLQNDQKCLQPLSGVQSNPKGWLRTGLLIPMLVCALGSSRSPGQQVQAHLPWSGARATEDDAVEPQADFRNTPLPPPAQLLSLTRRASTGNLTSVLRRWYLSHTGISYTPPLTDCISRGCWELPDQAAQDGESSGWHP